MHRARYNALHLVVHLRPKGPLLIKSGAISADPSLPDMQFVRTYHPERGETIYIPGSSLKGVVRGFIEKVLRTLDQPNSWRWACGTFDANSCGRKWHEAEVPSSRIYRESCGACRMFGHTRLRGRVSFTDFFPVSNVKTEIRYGVAISRLSHAVAQGPFEMEAVVSGVFEGHLLLENFELWQLALLSLALSSMESGLVKVGYGKNRGFGEVTVQVQEATLDEVARDFKPDVWRGTGALLDQGVCKDYGLYEPHLVEGLPNPARQDDLALYVRRRYDAQLWANAIARLLRAVA
ncbi:MAG TPA: RAMP superfamily CRISPR-associated protein [Dehalococcoidia bacterium]|nr:RAMP superfamily CRISPR-associated protein [Dehalococcoidia bacterium]